MPINLRSHRQRYIDPHGDCDWSIPVDQASALPALMQAIHARRSVRTYGGEPLNKTTIDALLHAAVQAPTAMHMEPWRFVIVQDGALLQRISDRAKAQVMQEESRLHGDHGEQSPFARPDFNVFYDAGTLIVICAGADGHFAQADCWLAAQNLMLAAQAMGLGSCVIGSAVAALNSPDTKQELGIAQAVCAVAPIIVGRPHGNTAPSPRKPPQILAWLGARE